jgi:hypothetical protein
MFAKHRRVKLSAIGRQPTDRIPREAAKGQCAPANFAEMPRTIVGPEIS